MLDSVLNELYQEEAGFLPVLRRESHCLTRFWKPLGRSATLPLAASHVRRGAASGEGGDAI